MPLRIAPWLGSCALLAASPAFAQADAAAAEALFQEGKKLLDTGRVPEACSKLGESYRLDPGTGALLLLAHCHEREGKLASAWAELSEAAARARKEGGAERESFARERAAALGPRLSRLKIEVGATTQRLAGLRIERNGVEVGRASFGAGLPVDGGGHTITASAPGYKTWSTTVRIGSEADAVEVSVPELVAEPQSVAPSDSGSTQAPRLTHESGLGGLRIAGIVSGGAGVVALGIGGLFALQAAEKKEESDDQGCDGRACPPEAAEARRDAVSKADLATIFTISGAVLAGAGVTLFVVGSSNREEVTHARAVELRVVPGGAALRGAF